MIADPFKVLGISPDATDAQVKKAYRDLSKQWHPDANPNNEKVAEENFKEIQEAYRQIVDARERGTSPYGPSGNSYGSAGPYQSYGAGPYQQYGAGSYQQYGSQGSGYQDTYAEYGAGYGAFNDFFNQWQTYSNQQRAQYESGEPNEMKAARNYINSGYFTEAMNALGQMPREARDARWYYYAAQAQLGLGNNVNAMEYAKRATDMDPGNPEYSMFLQRMQNGGTRYQQRQSQNYGSFGQGSSQWCMTLCLLNLFCNGFCGTGFFCC